jgi:hypothetical protein
MLPFFTKDWLMRKYITGIEALNLHRYDWHTTYIDSNKIYYLNLLREWCSYGIKKSVANPIRAFLDIIFYSIHYKKRVPNHKIDYFLFNEDEEKEILNLIETILKPKLSSEEKELLNKWIDYNNGDSYEFVKNPRRIRREATRRKNRAFKKYEKGFN